MNALPIALSRPAAVTHYPSAILHFTLPLSAERAFATQVHGRFEAGTPLAMATQGITTSYVEGLPGFEPVERDTAPRSHSLEDPAFHFNQRMRDNEPELAMLWRCTCARRWQSSSVT